MGRKNSLKSAFPIIHLAIADARWRQAHLEREFRRKNAAADRSIANNVRVIGSGAIDNATKAVRLVLAAKPQRQRLGRR